MTTDCHPTAWAERYVEQLRTACPERFSDSPVYFVRREALPTELWIDGEQVAFANPAGDRLFRDFLEPAGLWQGAGYAACFDLSAIGDEFLPGIVIHEASHMICYGDPGAVADPSDTLCQAVGWDPSAETKDDFLDRIDPPPGESPPVWHGHGVDFVRAALHLWHRWPVDVKLSHLRICGPRYGLSPVEVYLWRLERELADRRHASLRDVMLSEPPAGFRELFQVDTDCRA